MPTTITPLAAIRARPHGGLAPAREPVPGGCPAVRLGERGASSLEWALLTPILILVILLVIQFTMVYHARHVALAAAQSGARVARGTPTGDWRGLAGERARTSVRQFGPQLLADPSVTFPAGAEDQRYVEVSGQAVQVIPFMTFTVREKSGGPIECFRPDDRDGGPAGPGTDCERP